MAKSKHAPKDLLDKISKKAGRVLLPPNRVFKDKSKYNRKVKHKGGNRYDSPPFFYYFFREYVDTFLTSRYISFRCLVAESQ